MRMKEVFEFMVEHWEPVVAVLGFVLSLYNLFYLLKNNRKSLQLKEIYYLKTKVDHGKINYSFQLILANGSRVPISILDMQICNHQKLYSVRPDRQQYCTIHSSDEDLTYYSADFPLNLIGLESTKQQVIFTLDEELESEKLCLTIKTNRGTVRKRVDFSDKYMEDEEFLQYKMKNH